MNKLELSKFLLRIVLGTSFFIHGLVKFQNGISNTIERFDGYGISWVLAYIVAAVELFGGIALILGIGTRLVSVLFVFVMMGAIQKVKLADGFLGSAGITGYELNLAYLVIALFLALNGSKLWTIDQVLFNKKVPG